MNFYIQTDEILERLYNIFGQAVLIPLDRGYEPVSTRWKEITFRATQEAGYLRSLSSTNVAVVCGQFSGHLCGIQFNEMDAARRFLTKNPGLIHTLVSIHADGAVIWLRIKPGFCPLSKRLVTCRWLGQGEMVLVYDHDLEHRQIHFEGGPNPVEIEFSDIAWEPQDYLEFAPEIAQHQYGDPLVTAGKGKMRLNYEYWTYFYLFTSEVEYRPASRQFVRRDPEKSRWIVVHAEAILREIQNLLFRMGRAGGSKRLQRPLLTRERRELLNALKVVSASETGEETDGLEEFLAQQVEAKPGANVTSEELFQRYSCHCQNFCQVPLTKHEFLRQLPPVMKAIFGLTPAHNLEREGGQRRGYVNVALKCLEPLSEDQRTLRTPRTP